MPQDNGDDCKTSHYIGDQCICPCYIGVAKLEEKNLFNAYKKVCSEKGYGHVMFMGSYTRKPYLTTSNNLY